MRISKNLVMVSVLLRLLEEAEADERAGDVQEAEHRGGLAVEARREATVSEQPGVSPFNDPPEST